MRISRKMAIYSSPRGLVLFDGTVSPAINNTGTWTVKDGTGGEVVVSNGVLTVKSVHLNTITPYMVSNTPIDLTDLETLHVNICTSDGQGVQVGFADNTSAGEFSWRAVGNTTSQSYVTLDIDVSSITGIKYLVVTPNGSSLGIRSAYIKKAWLD